ncbi:class II histone deacetylase [Raphidocelis subcapitata]|uniref:Class II histone deacetylase n=1 Tax=Raphidocelis subcapitata TaxID=307507 RepID=A0A2V0PCR1_9CHLO|nr:class II histone deacetylase [Raphidocelis subcapitata]|eukprot:GBF95693.1 class II histone deacetylase [Raphidocelis subcapitata]
MAAQNGAAKKAPFHFCCEEIFMWHEPGATQNTRKGLQPTPHFESAESKRRLHNLLEVSGTLDALTRVRARPAPPEALARAHSAAHIDNVRKLSADSSKGCHRAGDALSFSPGAYEIACLAAGGAMALVDAVMGGSEAGARGGEAGRGAYGLVRPPGHHATRDEGMGFCIFNNVAVAAAHAIEAYGLERVAVVDFDVHHGNGTQSIFYDDPKVLTISLHQDSNYPIGSGPITDTGAGAGAGFCINAPLPPGSGGGAYRAAFDRIVLPALDAYRPQLIFVSAGFDASAMDPLASQMLVADDYAYFGRALAGAAAKHCPGRVVAMHEGG